MLRSMTGYGRAEAAGDDYLVQAEIRSVNGRFLKTHTKLPPQLTRFETDVEKVIKRRFSRGTIDVYVKFERVSNPGGYTFNVKAAHGYLQQLDALKDKFGFKGEATIDLLSTLPGVLTAEEESEHDVERLRPLIESAVSRAAEQVAAMRAKEGEELARDVANHLRTVESLLEQVKSSIPRALDEYKQRLRERVRQMLSDSDVNVTDQDLAREIVFYIERSNISEELARLASHIKQFDVIMHNGGSAGRQMEFLGQEMHREANTMGAKVNDAELSNVVTAIKTAIDKIREQVLNLE